MFKKDLQTWVDLGAEHTSSEIAQQPVTWLKTYQIIKDLKNELADFISSVTNHDNHEIILTGAGTSEFVGNTVFPVLLKGHKYNVRSIATTDLVASPDLYFNPNKPTLLVSYGRSGNSPESVAAVALADQVSNKVKHLIITCNHEGNLAKRDQENLFAIKLPEETNDKSLAMTSSYSNMYLATYLAFNLDALDALLPALKEVAAAGETFVNDTFSTLEEIVNTFDFERLIYLGDAQHTGVAQESSLKALEMTGGKVAAMYNTPLGFRHGPKSFINKNSLIVVFMQKDTYTRKYQIDLLKEIKEENDGYQVLVIDTQDDASIPELVDYYITIKYNVDVDLGLEVLNLIMFGQTVALFKSMQQALTPDNPSPSGVINRVVQGVVIYPFNKED